MDWISRRLPVVLPLLWAATLLVHAAMQVPEGMQAFWRSHPTLEEQRYRDPTLGSLHRFLDIVTPAIPDRARTILIGPPIPGWAGPREDHYKCFLFRMLPRPVRPVRSPADLPDLLTWADYVVVYRTPLSTDSLRNYTLHLDLGNEGRVLRRKGARP